MVSEVTVSRARIRWLCRRGMKELDVLLERFFSAEFDHLSAAEQDAFHSLVQAEDPDIYNYLLGREQPKNAALVTLVGRIRTYQQVAGRG